MGKLSAGHPPQLRSCPGIVQTHESVQRSLTHPWGAAVPQKFQDPRANLTVEPSVPSQRLYTLRRPLGVVGLITPWNFPIAIPVWKLAPALIYGNTVVHKLGYVAPRTGLPVAVAFA